MWEGTLGQGVPAAGIQRGLEAKGARIAKTRGMTCINCLTKRKRRYLKTLNVPHGKWDGEPSNKG